MSTENTKANEAAEPTGWIMTAGVAAILKVSPKTVSRWAKEGKLPYRKTLGGHRRYPEDEIRALAGPTTRPTQKVTS